MSARTRRLSRERSARRKKKEKRTGKKIDPFKFERQDSFVPEGETKAISTKEYKRRQKEAKKKKEVKVVKKETAAEVIVMEDRKGVKAPTEEKEKKEKESIWGKIWASFNNWATWKEGSKMREEVSVAQVVEATVMGVGIAATGVAIAGVGVAAAASTAGAKLISSGGLSAAPVARAAAGQIVKDTGKVILRKAATNTVTAKKTVSFLGKLAATAKKPAFVLGALGAYAFGTQLAYNERGDTAMSLSIAARDAAAAGDIETMEEIKEMTDDLANPDMLQTLTNFAPIINYPLSAIQKMRAAKYAVDKAIERQQGEYKPSPLTEAKRAEEEAYYKEVAERKNEAKAQNRKAEEAYWEQLEREKEERQEQARKSDEAYWKKIREDNAAAKEEERAAEEAYWANIRAKND